MEIQENALANDGLRPCREDVQLLAYHFWEERGRPMGTSELDWVRAEHEVHARGGEQKEPLAVTAAKTFGAALGRACRMTTQDAIASRRLHGVAVLFLAMGPLVLCAQTSSTERLGSRDQRQNVAALKKVRRLSLKAEMYDRQGKPQKAERTAQRALALEEQVHGPWHIDVANRLDQVADLYTAHKKEDAAEPLYGRARAIRERALSEHPDVYERDGGEIRVRRNQPAEKASEGLPARK